MSRSFKSILNEVERMDDERYDVFLTELAETLDRRYEVADRELEEAANEGLLPGGIEMGGNDWAVDALMEEQLYHMIVDSIDSDQEEFVDSVREYRDELDRKTHFSDGAEGIERYVRETFIGPLEESRQV